MPIDPKADELLKRLADYEAKGISTKPLYDEWSQTYEADLLGTFGYSGHIIAADAFKPLVHDKAAAIIDIGCGTGLVGQELKKAGYASIDGLDISAAMLAQAKAKNIYGRLIEGDMRQRTSVEDAAYDAVICAGSFAPGHLGPQCYREFIRMVRPGGPIVIFMNGAHYAEDGYEAHIRKLEAEGAWTVIAIKAFNYMSALERPGQLIMARKG
ncbi:MAG: class I SAM-dependent methyltransferase [Rhizobiaceae bacterium]